VRKIVAAAAGKLRNFSLKFAIKSAWEFISLLAERKFYSMILVFNN
jgi:hypothetical protein